MNFEQIQHALRRALILSEGGLSAADVESAQLYLDHGEPALALELTCIQLDDHDAPVTQAAFEELRSAGTEMGLEPSLWQDYLSIEG